MATKQSKRFTEQGYINIIADWFCQRGWYVVDQKLPGVFTRKIFASNDGTMIAKISGPDADIWSADTRDAYPLFAQWAATQNNPHLPKIYQARSLKRYNLFLTVMERLEHLDYETIEDCAYHGNVESLPEARQAKTAGYVRKAMFCKNLGFIAGKNFQSLVDCIVRMADHFGCLPTDLHAGNMMLRGNTLVLSDPYSWIRNIRRVTIRPYNANVPSWVNDVKTVYEENIYYTSDCDCSLCNPKTAIISYVAGAVTLREQRIQQLADMLLGRKKRKA